MDLTFLKAWIQTKFNKNEEGAGLVEYVLLVGLIAIVVIGAVIFLQSRVSSTFSKAGSSLT
jgi:Flp pilus assembly pilin Flp